VKFKDYIQRLRTYYGPPRKPRVTRAWEIILYENVAYLVDDQRRDEVWAELKKAVGVTPRKILEAPPAKVAAVIARGGMQPAHRADKLRRAAVIAMDTFDGDVDSALGWPLKTLRRGLKKFPGIGDPGADKILMLTRTAPVLSLDSSGLRVLLRLGYGSSEGGYAAQYASVQEAIAPELPKDYDALIAAHQLLRQHGQTLCSRNAPECEQCPLARWCPSAGRAAVEA